MSSLSQQKILFIDDLPNLCEEMVTILRSVDLDAEAMLSPHAAIPRIARGEFALVITGLVIAELNGFEIPESHQQGRQLHREKHRRLANPALRKLSAFLTHLLQVLVFSHSWQFR